MRVLFAVNNDNISDAIIKKYQKEYKEILSCKNVYYFNAILKELQNNKNYDRVVISEDLEPFANNNYDTIDKFLFEKLDKISDEATKANGDDIEIIVICADRRAKSDDMLVKFFSIGIYNAIIGQDRSIDQLCKLIRQPRTKKDAKLYYKIESNNVEYQAESENNVSEAEVQNILAHYKRLGKNEDKYLDSFNNIVSQYTDAQLRIIIKYLPMHVKAVLEERSPKYQQLSTFSVPKNRASNEPYKPKSLKTVKEDNEEKINVKMINSESSKPKMTKPIVIPSTLAGTKPKVSKEVIKKVEKPKVEVPDLDFEDEEPQVVAEKPQAATEKPKVKKIEVKPIEVEPIKVEEVTEKRGRGRPRKNPLPEEVQEEKPKRGRGRPKKVVEEKKEQKEDEEDLFVVDELNDVKAVETIPENEELDLFNLDESNEEDIEQIDEEIDLFGLDEDEDLANEEENEDSEAEEIDLFSLNEEDEIDNEYEDEYEQEEPIDLEEELDLFNLDEEEEPAQENKNGNDNNDDEFDLFASIEEEQDSLNLYDEDISEQGQPQGIAPIRDSYEENVGIYNEEKVKPKQIMTQTNSVAKENTTAIISKDKKLVSFVGTTKNGTSFVVNNLAVMLSTMNLSTAILDITKSRNAYYIFTNNEEKLRETATTCMEKLEKGIANGIKVNKNLTVYTGLPGDEIQYNNIGTMLNTVLENHDIVLIDCDFNTPVEFFENSQEIYLVQSMDVLTIQPLTAFLRTLKAKNVLKQEKVKIIINKEQKVKGLSAKVLVGGMAYYNDPAMSFMTELFDKDNVQVLTIPFEVQNYSAYLEALVNCQISFGGYTKQFLNSISEIAAVVYPLMNKPRKFRPLEKNKKETMTFSNQTNDTLNKMRKNY